jgi:hypothetical protein
METRHESDARQPALATEPVPDGLPTQAEPGLGTLPPCPVPWRHPLRAAGWLVTVAVGIVSLALVLAVLAAIPLLNFLALGTMLEAEGRVVRSGRLRDGIPFAAALPRIGSIVVGTWLWLLVVRFLAQAADDATLIDPGGPAARGFEAARTVTAVAVGIHITAAIFCGGGLTTFFRPLKNLRRLLAAIRGGTAWTTAAHALRRVLDAVQPGRLMWLGLRGFVGGFLWILLPTMLFAALRDTTRPGEVVVTLVGAALLGTVLSWVPFLQARFAADRRFAIFRDVGAVRTLWRRAPVAMLGAVVVLYGLSLPLYLFKIFAAPRDAVLFLTPMFVVTIYPARLAVGLATHAAAVRTRPAALPFRAVVAVLFVPLMALYLFLLFFTPAIDAFGRRALFDHHALLLPTPF